MCLSDDSRCSILYVRKNLIRCKCIGIVLIKWTHYIAETDDKSIKTDVLLDFILEFVHLRSIFDSELRRVSY